MTLIAAAASNHAVWQVSDRLVSTKTGKFDELANKSVIFAGATWIATLGYTGTAYIGSLPTDEWIAETLLKAAIPRREFTGELVVPATQDFPVPHNSIPDFVQPGATLVHVGRQKTFLNLSAAMYHLANEIDNAFSSGLVPANASMHGLEISVAGWEWSAHRPSRPVLFSLLKRPGKRTQRVRGAPRRFTGMYFRFVPRGYSTPDDVAHFRSRATGLVATEPALIESVQRIAAREPDRIGNELMSVVIPEPRRYRGIEIRFVPLQPVKMTIYGKPTEIAYTPWILTPGGWAAPAIMVGTQRLQLGGWRIILEAPRSTGAVLGAMYPQRRKARP
jgi:hypothetical protein